MNTQLPDVYDQLDWHLTDDFPSDLPDNAAALPMAFYWHWLNEIGLASTPAKAADRTESPLSAIVSHGSRLTPAMLSEQGNAFTLAYYEYYLEDIADLAVDAFQDEDMTPYELPDDWEVYEAVKIILDARFEDWQNDPAAPFEPLILTDEDEE